MNGEIDIGQAEGAFVMGMGFWLTENFKYDPDSGQCLTDGTWEYKVYRDFLFFCFFLSQITKI
jgi:xanthine dehydrogenase/oxidase